MPRRWSIAFAALLVLLGAVLRVWQARESFWVDELHTAWCTGGSLADVAPRAAIGNQSPLFFWFEWLLMQFGDKSEYTLRLPSLIAGTLLPLALYGLAWRWTRSDLVALVAAALVVVDPRSIFYATEARPYALVELLAALHAALFLELLASPSIRLRIAFVLGGGLLFHLHYTAVLLIAAEVAYWLLAHCIDAAALRYKFWWLLIDLFYLGVTAAPAAGNIASIAARRENWERFVLQRPASDILLLLPWSALVLFVLVDVDALLVRCPSPQSDSKLRDELRVLFTTVWLLVPLTLAWLLTATDIARLLAIRYVLVSAPAAILIASLITRLPPWPHTRLTLGLSMVGLAIWSSSIIPQFRADGRVIAERREDWRSASQWLNEQLPGTRLPILVRSGLIESDALRGKHDPLLKDYCLLPVASLYRLQARREDLVPLPSNKAWKLAPETLRLVRERGGLWLVNRSNEQASRSVEQGLIAGLEAAEPRRQSKPKWRVVESRSFGNVQIRKIARTSEA